MRQQQQFLVPIVYSIMYSQMHYTWVLLYLQKFPKQHFCTLFSMYQRLVHIKFSCLERKMVVHNILHCDSIHFRCFFRTFFGGFSSLQKLNFKLASLLHFLELLQIFGKTYHQTCRGLGLFLGAGGPFRIHRN